MLFIQRPFLLVVIVFGVFFSAHAYHIKTRQENPLWQQFLNLTLQTVLSPNESTNNGCKPGLWAFLLRKSLLSLQQALVLKVLQKSIWVEKQNTLNAQSLLVFTKLRHLTVIPLSNVLYDLWAFDMARDGNAANAKRATSEVKHKSFEQLFYVTGQKLTH